MMPAQRSRVGFYLLAVVGFLLGGVLVFAFLQQRAPVRQPGTPDPVALEQLRAYLYPTDPNPKWLEEERVRMGLDAREIPELAAPPVTTERTPAPASTPLPDRELSAIILQGDWRAAVIDQRIVSEGEELPDGARVVSIEPDAVLLREPGGPVRRLELRIRTEP